MRPHGRLQISCATFDDHALYGRLLADAPRTGRCPVLLSDDALPRLSNDRVPASALARLERHDAAAVLADRWPGTCLTCSDWLAPFGATFPGLAPRFADVADLQPAAVVQAAVREAAEPRHLLLGIAPVGTAGGLSRRRPGGAACATPGTTSPRCPRCCAAGRTGSARYSCGMYRSTLELAVAAPPWKEEDCRRVAAEHFAFTCDDDSPTPETLSRYAQRLRGARRWSFWWD